MAESDFQEPQATIEETIGEDKQARQAKITFMAEEIKEVLSSNGLEGPFWSIE